jgi:hypothetical protein
MRYATISAPAISPTRHVCFALTAPKRKTFCLLLALFIAVTLLMSSAWAVDLTALASIGGPLQSALTQLADLTPGVKALIGVIGFLVAFIALAAARNASPVMFYLMMLIFGAVGLPIGGAILGAVI